MARKPHIFGVESYVEELYNCQQVTRVCPAARLWHNVLIDSNAGIVAKSTDRYLPPPAKSRSGPTYTSVDDDIEIQEEEDEPPEPVKVVEALSSFENVVVWSHDRVPTSEDPFVKGLDEWISFAEAIHGKPDMPIQEVPAGKGTGSET